MRTTKSTEPRHLQIGHGIRPQPFDVVSPSGSSWTNAGSARVLTPDGMGRIAGKLAHVAHLRHQAPKGGDKIYALHEPEVDCISKGKARVRYEFGCKVIIATTLDDGFVTGHARLRGQPL